MILTAVLPLDVLAWVSWLESSPRKPHGSVDDVVGVNERVEHPTTQNGLTIVVCDRDRSMLLAAAGEHGGHCGCGEECKVNGVQGSIRMGRMGIEVGTQQGTE